MTALSDTHHHHDDFVPSFLTIKAMQIENWADQIDARTLLPVLEAVLKTRTAFEKLSNQPPDASQNAPYHRYIHPICLIFYFCFRAYNNFKTASYYGNSFIQQAKTSIKLTFPATTTRSATDPTVSSHLALPTLGFLMGFPIGSSAPTRTHVTKRRRIIPLG